MEGAEKFLKELWRKTKRLVLLVEKSPMKVISIGESMQDIL